MDIAKLVARLELQSAQFQSELEKTNRKLLGFQKQANTSLSSIERSFKSFSNVLKVGFAGLSVGMLASSIRQAVEFGDEIGKAAVKAGIGAREMSELAAAGKQFDISLKSVSDSLRFMQVNLSKATSGGRAQAEAFRAIGVEISDLQGMKADQQFERIAEGISRLQKAEDKARAATEIFGKAGADLLPMFERGAAGIREAREQAEKFGRVMDDKTVKAMQEADDAMKKLTATWEKFTGVLAVGTVKALQFADVIDKDKIGELLDQIERTKRELQEASGLGFDQIVDGKRIDELTKKLERLNMQLVFATSPGKTRPAKGSNAPGFQAPPDSITKSFLNPQTMLEFEQNASFLENEARNTAESFAEAFEYEEDVAKAAAGGIKNSHADMSEALRMHFQEVGSVLDDTLDKTTRMSVFAEEAARNMQGHFADFLFDPFQDGLKGMLKGFADTIRRMLAEAASAKLFEALFGESGSGGGAGNWLGTLIGAFGGGKASGGPLQSGKWYIAGEHGPEPIWGGGPGAFAMGYGGGGVTINMPIDARGATVDAVRRLESQMPAIIRQAADIAKAELREDRRRGRF